MTSGELAEKLRQGALQPYQEVYVRGSVLTGRPTGDGCRAAGRLVEVAAEEVQVRS